MSADPEQGSEAQRALRRVTQVSSPTGLEERVMRRLQKAEAAETAMAARPRLSQRWSLPVGLAAALLLIAGVVGVLPRRHVRPVAPVPAQVARTAPRIQVESAMSSETSGPARRIRDAGARRTSWHPATHLRQRVGAPASLDVASYPSRSSPITHQEELLLQLARLHTPEALPAQQTLMHSEPAVVIGKPLPLVTLNNISGDQP